MKLRPPGFDFYQYKQDIAHQGLYEFAPNKLTSQHVASDSDVAQTATHNGVARAIKFVGHLIPAVTRTQLGRLGGGIKLDLVQAAGRDERATVYARKVEVRVVAARLDGKRLIGLAESLDDGGDLLRVLGVQNARRVEFSAPGALLVS